MKKFFPAITISSIFLTILVLQVGLGGNHLNAQKASESEKRNALYEKVLKDLEVVTTKKTKINFKSVGEKVLILNFWASWCRPCLSEFKALNKLIKTVDSKDLLVIGVNNDDEDSAKAIIKTTKKYGLNFESINDSKFGITSKFLIEKIPATIVFHKGKVVFFANEEYDFMNEKFLYKIKKLLKK